MIVSIVFGPDEECVDPLSHTGEGRRHAEVIPDDADVIVIWRVPHGDQDTDEGHEDVHVVGGGVFENVTLDEVQEALEKLGAAP